jgi:2-isopropylmalate synthase
MDQVGIHVADIGLPGQLEARLRRRAAMCQEITGNKLKIRPACAGRTVVSDITPMIEISQRAGIPVEVYTFIGSSPIRQLAEDWDVELIAQALAPRRSTFAVKARACRSYVTEDTTRSRARGARDPLQERDRPRRLAPLPLRHGRPRRRPTACATSSASPNLLAGDGRDHVGIDWHGHNDRGLGAGQRAHGRSSEGADRVHGTASASASAWATPRWSSSAEPQALGALERPRPHQPLALLRRGRAKAVGMPIPINYPLVGRDAFRTRRACTRRRSSRRRQKGDAWLADRIYSGVPAGMFGREQEI